jgi:hypothetical protein
MSTTEGDRPAIPAELRRRVLVEAGHRCAIPTCRYIDVEIHHIVDWAKCREHEYDNLIALCPNCHGMAGRGEIDRKSLRTYKANLRYLTDKFSQVEMDIMFDLYKEPPGRCYTWIPQLTILINRSIQAGYLAVMTSRPGFHTIVGGMQMSPVEVHLTPSGRSFVASLSDSNL